MDEFSKFSVVTVNGKRHFVHVLVFMAFNNRKPIGPVRHDPSLPYDELHDEDGFYRNHADHLIDSFYQVDELENGKVIKKYPSLEEAARRTGLSLESVQNNPSRFRVFDLPSEAFSEAFSEPAAETPAAETPWTDEDTPAS